MKRAFFSSSSRSIFSFFWWASCRRIASGSLSMYCRNQPFSVSSTVQNPVGSDIKMERKWQQYYNCSQICPQSPKFIYYANHVDLMNHLHTSLPACYLRPRAHIRWHFTVTPRTDEGCNLLSIGQSQDSNSSLTLKWFQFKNYSSCGPMPAYTVWMKKSRGLAP